MEMRALSVNSHQNLRGLGRGIRVAFGLGLLPDRASFYNTYIC
jgi:hypothetical protein